MYKIKHQPDIDELLKAEEEDPSPQRDLGDRTIYTSRPFQNVKCLGIPILADFGHALVMEQKGFKQNAQPDAYRAPEVLLSAQWGYSVDIWNLVCLVSSAKLGRDWELPSNIEYRSGRCMKARIFSMSIIPKLGSTTTSYMQRQYRQKSVLHRWIMRFVVLQLKDFSVTMACSCGFTNST